VFTARYGLSPYIKQIRLVLKGLLLEIKMLNNTNKKKKNNINTHRKFQHQMDRMFQVAC